jgi:hypothetical protein
MYVSGYQSSNYSMAAAISLAAFALTFTMIGLAITFERKVVYYAVS